MNSIPVAQAEGIYQCAGCKQTMHREVGQELTPCSCGEAWELCFADQVRLQDTVLMLIGRRGLIRFTGIVELPEIGTEYNFRGISTIPGGKYRVTEVGTMQWGGRNHIHVLVERVGDTDPRMPVHALGIANI